MILALPVMAKINPIFKIGLAAGLDKVTPELLENPNVQAFFVTMNEVAQKRGMSLMDYVQTGEILTDVLDRMGVDRSAFSTQTNTHPRLVARQLPDGTVEYKVIRPE